MDKLIIRCNWSYKPMVDPKVDQCTFHEEIQISNISKESFEFASKELEQRQTLISFAGNRYCLLHYPIAVKAYLNELNKSMNEILDGISEDIKLSPMPTYFNIDKLKVKAKIFSDLYIDMLGTLSGLKVPYEDIKIEKKGLLTKL